MNMGKTIRDLSNGTKPVVWLDFYDYGAGLLANGEIPWLDQANFSAFFGKAQALLKSAVISLPVERVADALLAAHPSLREEMRAKSRTSYPLRRLLEQASLREAVAGLLAPLRAANADRPLVLNVPSPRRWLALAYEQAHGRSLDPAIAGNGDEIGGASMYLADFLGAFSEAGVDAVLLAETPGIVALDEQQIAWYGPVLNKAHHYRWEAGLLAADAQGAIVRGDLDFVVAPGLPADIPGGCMVAEGFWNGAAAPSLCASQFHYAIVPTDAVPETVLQRLAAMD
jgi:hypothetical protein